MNTKEELEKIIKDSNYFEELSKDDKLFKIYNRNQALNRQWVDESREYHSLKDKLGDKFPYKTLGGFKRARRSEHQSNTLKYARLATKSYQKGLKLLNKNAIINKEKQREIKGFVSSKTKEEAEQFLTKYARTVSYDGVDNIVSLNQTNRTFSYLSEKYSIKPISISTKMRSKTAGAEAHGGVLNINKKMLKNPKGFWKSSTTDWQKTCDARIENQKNKNERNIKSAQSNLQRAIESGGDETNIRYYKSVLRKAENQAKKALEIELDKKNYSRHNVIYKDREVECTITHETGHIIADQYFGQITNRLFCNDYMEQTNIKKRQIILQTYRQAKENKDIYKISAYAKENEIEFFAESFTMYELKVEKLPEYINKMFEEVLK